MPQLYVPEGVFLVCSEGMKIQELQVASQTTIRIMDGRLMGTENDRMNGNLNCALMVVAGAIVGAIIGAVIIAAVILSGGTLGAVAAGAICAGCAAGGAAIGAFVPCFCAILTSGWIPVHPYVLGESQKALLDNSVIPCKLSGLVEIVYTKEKANAMTNFKIAETVLSTCAVIFLAYTGGAAIAGLLSAGGSVLATYKTFKLKAAAYQVAFLGFNTFGPNPIAWVLDSTYDWIKKQEINGETISSHIVGTADGVNDTRVNRIMGGEEDISIIETIDITPDDVKDISNTQISSYYRLEQETVQLQYTGNTISVAPDGTAYNPDQIIINNSHRTTILSNEGQGASILSNDPNIIEQSFTISADGTRATDNQIIETTGMQHANSIGAYVKNQFFSKDALKGSFIALGKKILVDATRVAANKALASFMQKQIEAEKIEEAAKAKITVLEHDI